MADCDGFTLTIPDLTCASDLEQWASDLANAMQAAVDHIVACINEYEYPQCDICVIKDDLVQCPLDCNMINFYGITYGDEGDVCQLPKPAQGLDFKWGSGTTEQRVTGPWPTFQVSVAFDTPFDNECLYAGVFYDSATACSPGDSGGLNVMHLWAPLVRNVTKDGFVFWPCAEDNLTACFVSYRWFAVGR